MRLLSLPALVALAAIATDPAPIRGGEMDVAAAFALTGLEPQDLARPFRGEGLEGPRQMAADPLALPGQVPLLAEELLAADPGDAVAAAWSELGVVVRYRAPPTCSLSDHLARRRDGAVLRSLDPGFRSLLTAVVAASTELRARPNAPEPAVQARVLSLLASPRPGTVAGLSTLAADARPPDPRGELASLSAALLARIDPLTLADAEWPASALVVHTDAGRIWIGSPGDDRFDAPFLAVVDPGGDDRYEGNGHPQPLSITLDMGGDDAYRELPPTPGGIAIVIDLAGDDLYDGDAVAAAAWGCSVLLDAAGDDTYVSGPWGLGAGVWGVGLLLDRAGDDLYRVRGPGQGVGGPGGFGGLIDSAGDDVYVADADRAQGHGLGVAPSMPGGIGLLVDGAGQDTYRAQSWSQGSGSWRGAGLAVDLSGDDRWSATDWSQGAGVHEGVGVLLDLEGADRYTGMHGVQGAAQDRGVGLLQDLRGDDMLQAEDHAQGASSSGGLACALDGGGNDAYYARGRRWGATDALRGEESIALLLDAGGEDVRGPGDDLAEGRAIQPGRHGIGIDIPDLQTASTAPMPSSPAARSGTDDLETLLHAAVGWPDDPVGAEMATSLLARPGPSVYPTLREHLDLSNPVHAVAMGRTLDRIAEADPAAREDLLQRILADVEAPGVGSQAEYLLVWSARLSAGEVPPQHALRHLAHADPAVRRAAAAVLEASAAEPTVCHALLRVLAEDTEQGVRAAAARSLGRSRSATAVEPLVALLPSATLATRDAASRSLVLLACDGLDAEVRIAVRPVAVAGDIAALEVLARVPDPISVPHLVALLERGPPAVRGHAALALGAVGSGTTRKALLGREAVEAHPYVIECLDRALRTPGNPPAIAPVLR